ncbi:NAD(P)H-binding protein [Actinophytocola oryzae]|uniref:Uncharacterized protein YbjT (DUF2867 family) n=1 Tax=Actinophytocola oryzae TaxID=502181 RepID=A0A4R7V2L3_9PSEU|nr:NAD(P)H-binding protein [Actinophytocola oryzae]TDV43593.1 uncharacterized protein YbjT (DUF2867 family) [Actinophytocola oryzae]
MYLVTGATGTVGRPLVELLRGSGVRAVSRSVTELPGAEVVTEPEFTGVDGVFLNARAVGLDAADLLARAGEQGVRRVVVLAASNVDEPLDEQPSRFNGDRNAEVEAAAIDSGLEWVSLRPTYFAVNAEYSWGGQLRRGDVVRAPFPEATEAPIDPRDIAAVAAAALTTDDLVGDKLLLTGPESLTHTEMVATIGRVLGRDLRLEPVPVEIASRVLVDNGHRPEFVTALMDRYRREAGRPAHVSADAEKALGRPPRPFAEWVADHAALFTRA